MCTEHYTLCATRQIQDLLLRKLLRAYNVQMDSTGHTCEFRGWVKWVVVIAALLTISNACYELFTGMRDAFRANLVDARQK